MTSTLIKTASATALLLGAGFAAPLGAQEMTDPTAEDPATLEESPDLQQAPDQGTQLVGQSVFDSNGQEVGIVEDVVTGDDGSELAVLSVGDFLGIGPKKISVPASELQPNAEGTGLTIAMTAEDIEAAPTYEGGDAPEEEY